jgi:hypothetical protein
MPYGQCTARVTGQHRTASGAARCPVHGNRGTSWQRGWTRTATASPPSVHLPPSPKPAFTNYSGLYDQKRSELTENVLALMSQAPGERLRDATFDLIGALTPSGTSVPDSAHLLCHLFEAFAVGLQDIIDVPSIAINHLVGKTVAGSMIVAAAVKALLKQAVQLAIANPMAPLHALHLQACPCAVFFCPDTGAHPSLEQNCEIPLAKAALDK